MKISITQPHGRTWNKEVYCQSGARIIMNGLEKDRVEDNDADGIHLKRTDLLFCFVFLKQGDHLKIALGGHEYKPPSDPELVRIQKFGKPSPKKSYPKYMLDISDRKQRGAPGWLS